MFISNNTGATSRQLVYFAENVTDFFMSKSCCRDLNIIPHNFPGPIKEPPAAPHPPTNPPGFGNQGGYSSIPGVYNVSAHTSPNHPIPYVHHQHTDNTASGAPSGLSKQQVLHQHTDTAACGAPSGPSGQQLYHLHHQFKEPAVPHPQSTHLGLGI